ncbi:MAG: hypothetical protein GY725_03135, partial [bacterium]|nr:hypothetical protein [bacterium]
MNYRTLLICAALICACSSNRNPPQSTRLSLELRPSEVVTIESFCPKVDLEFLRQRLEAARARALRETGVERSFAGWVIVARPL